MIFGWFELLGSKKCHYSLEYIWRSLAKVREFARTAEAVEIVRLYSIYNYYQSAPPQPHIYKPHLKLLSIILKRDCTRYRYS